MRRFVIVVALLVACGGGASVPGGDDDDVPPGGSPTTQIVSSNCQLSGNTVIVDVAFNTTLGVGQAWESEILVLDASSFGTQLGESQFFSCGAWSETGSGSSAKGCQRNSASDPATQSVSHNLSASFEQSVFPPLDVMIFANTLESPGGINVGSGDNESISCF